MNFNDTLDPQIAEALLKRPCLDQLSRYVAGLATPVQAELIEAHMQRSPEVRMDVEALRQDLDTFSEALHQSFQQKEPALPTENDRIAAAGAHHLALAGSEKKDVCSKMDLETFGGLGGIPGLSGVVRASVEAPTLTTTISLSIKAANESPNVPDRILVRWKTGERKSRPFEFRDGRWRANVVIPEPWAKVSNWLSQDAVKFIAPDC